jgi:hypothetical protein
MVVMLELMILAGLVLWGVVAFVDTGAGHRTAGRLGRLISTIIARYCATIAEMNYASRRQAELFLELDRPRQTTNN